MTEPAATVPTSLWVGFSIVVGILLVLDLFVLNRKSEVMTPRKAAGWSATLVTMAMAFCAFLWLTQGGKMGLEFLTGYLIELSLSVDNLFVFILIFQYFSVPGYLQPKVLKWGIIGAIVMRAIMIALGAIMLQRFTWIIFVFGGILIFTGIKMLTARGDERFEPEKTRSSRSRASSSGSHRPTRTTNFSSRAMPVGTRRHFFWC